MPPQMNKDFENTSHSWLTQPESLAVAHFSKTNIVCSTGILTSIQRYEAIIQHALATCRKIDNKLERVSSWILDNDYQIKRAIRQTKQDLPDAFYQELPSTTLEQDRVIPCVLDIAETILLESQLQVSLSSITEFVKRYQSQHALLHGELWALPAMIRLGCLKVLVDSLIKLDPSLIGSAAQSAGRQLPIDDPAECVARTITSMVILNSIDWPAFVDRASKLERVLSDDPICAYHQMNFATRERYRNAVEAIAKHVEHTEFEVASHCVELAKEAETGTRQSHVGYWLIDEGVSALCVRVGCKHNLVRYTNALQNHAALFYGSLLTLSTLGALCLPYWYLDKNSASVFQLTMSLCLLLIPATVLAVTVVHWLVPKLTQPSTLPALDFSGSIPTEYRCAVVVPVILKSVNDAIEAIQKLELHWYSNPDPALKYVLLSDPADAGQQYLTIDVEIEKQLKQGIDNLNKLHAKKLQPFVLLHRHRVFSEGENCWMAWERKRGKLENFNHFLIHGDAEPFKLTAGALDSLHNTQYVITLDADTLLPPGSAADLVGTMSHPLNKASIDDCTGRIEKGYTVLQPRVELVQDVGDHSVFAKIYAGDSAIDIYSRAASDVYQDLFDSGLYVGKGIYDVVAFQKSIEQRMPENQILSHDLIEGVHGRVGLVSNIVVYEQFPDTYPEYAMRQHRWIRGDWQLLPWLANKVPTAGGNMDKNPLSVLDRWKIVDNLRRSLVSPIVLLLLVFGWLILPGSAIAWTALAVAVMGSFMLNDAWKGVSQTMTLKLSAGVIHSLQQQLQRWFLSVVFLANDSIVGTDAIVRALWRTYRSKQHLLQWHSAAHLRQSIQSQSLHGLHWKTMWQGTLLGILIATVLLRYNPNALWAAAPLVVLWIMAPEIAYRLGRHREFRRETLDSKDQLFLREVARRTWHYFDTFARPQDHWLPPDNFQQEPKGEIAHRTSPTNIGLYLVSTLIARDFGFIGSSELSVRVSNTLSTLDKLEMHHGHLLNWYDTVSLKPLEPKYVSTVDNGNFAVSLLAMKQGCLERANSPLLDQCAGAGLDASFKLLISSINVDTLNNKTDFKHVIQLMESHISQLYATDKSWFPRWNTLFQQDWPILQKYIGDLLISESLAPKALAELHTWYERFTHQLQVLQRDIDRYFPWLHFVSNNQGNHSNFHTELSAELAFKPIPELIDIYESSIAQLSTHVLVKDDTQWRVSFKALLVKSLKEVRQLQVDLEECAQRAHAMAYAMDFDFLYDSEAHLFRIGYNVSAGRFDHNTYDLLASEARLASYFAIAKNDVPIKHWAHLGRPISRVGKKPILLSWSGSMFEYLMPPLFLPGKRETLLGESERLAVIAQQHYAKKLKVPWGISESAFGALDADSNYQYRAFGAPALGLRRELDHDLVIAPYASALALCVMPKSAVRNLRELRDLDTLRLYGFIDALDFTGNRRNADGSPLLVENYMAHHQGMTLAAIANTLNTDILTTRVLREKPLRTIELLLQERVPWDAPIEIARKNALPETPQNTATASSMPSWQVRTDGDVPPIQIMGNGTLSSWIYAFGGGALYYKKTALTRWTSYQAGYNGGTYLYVGVTNHHTSKLQQSSLLTKAENDLETNAQVTGYKAIFSPHKVEQHRNFDDVAVQQTITVAPNDNVEVRTVSVNNNSDETKYITLTSYAEVSLASPADDERHPAFSKLFVFSEYIPQTNGILFVRRARDADSKPPVLLHKVLSDDSDVSMSGFESDRNKFLGRHGSLDNPHAIKHGLSGSVGWTQDAIMSVQVRIKLNPAEQKQIAFLTIAAASRHEVLEIASRYPAPTLDWLIQNAHIAVSHEISQLEIGLNSLPILQTLVSALLHRVSVLRVHEGDSARLSASQTLLWQFGISGDLPILLLNMGHHETSGILERLIRAQQLWRRKGVEFDLVIMRNDLAGYEEPIRDQILSILRDVNVYGFLGQKGGIHLLSADHIAPDLRNSIKSQASVVLQDNNLTLEQQLERLWQPSKVPPLFNPLPNQSYLPITDLQRPLNLLFDNGIGGFDSNSGNYVVHMEPGESTPAPWCNVIANKDFGTVVNESGLGFTWHGNSGEYRLSPWANDPVADVCAEVLYLRDEMSADKWTVTPEPLGQANSVQVTHAPGFTRWQQNSHGLEQSLETSVAVSDPVKLITLQLKNRSDIPRRITATYYVDWCLGAVSSQSRPHVRANYDTELKTVFASNAWNPEFSDCVAFVFATLQPHSVSGDRGDFLGAQRNIARPQGIDRWDLGGHFSPTADPCAAFQVHIDIAPGETEEVVFVLGAAQTKREAKEVISRLQSNNSCMAAADAAKTYWESRLDSLQVKSPDAAFNLMINRWLPYQVMSCRLFARAGYYQAGGAFGFRDQLQDVLSLLIYEPHLARVQIIEAAKHQFEQGDVLHWWHPPSGRGVRTRCSDDYLWLAYVVARYIKATGDYNILDVEVPFLRASPLHSDEHDRYALYPTGEIGTIYTHCCRSLQFMQTLGAHGLPLIGDGDWNDGMNRVGQHGLGESVWLAWFQISTINLFKPIFVYKDDEELAKHLTQYTDDLKTAVEANAWDGDWYIRAFDDEGVAWGSSKNDECKIDSLSQTWAVLSGAADEFRAKKAMTTAASLLVDAEHRLVRLLAPPFENTPRDPGYIKAYPPGVRENGGQYSHAAAWFGMAAAAIGEGELALQTFDSICPTKRCSSMESTLHYAREPYVVPGDISGSTSDPGKGGWSWYTGAASWVWQLGVHSMLGINFAQNGITVEPCLSKQWDHIEVIIRHNSATISLRIENPDAVCTGDLKLLVDGQAHHEQLIEFPEKNKIKRVVVLMTKP